MTTFAQVRNSLVLSHFTKDMTLAEAKAEFADIAHELHEAPDDVQDGMAMDGDSFAFPAPQVPEVVTMRQARLALRRAGALGGVDAAIDAMPEPDRTDARIEWEYSQEVQRNKPLVTALGPALGLTSEQIDELFILAASL